MSQLPPTIVIPLANLGLASSYDKELFPLSSFRKKDSLGRSQLFLDATLSEMFRMKDIGNDPSGECEKLIQKTKARYDQLMCQKETLDKRPKSKNPVKLLSNFRADLLFLATTRSFYIATRSRSDDMIRTYGRNLLSLPREDFQPVNDDIPSDAGIAGIAVRLDQPLDDASAQQILDAVNSIASCSSSFVNDPFADPTTSVTSNMAGIFDSSEGQISDPASTVSLLANARESPPDPRSSHRTLSPTIINNFYNAIISNGSVVHGATLNQGGSENSGSVNSYNQ